MQGDRVLCELCYSSKTASKAAPADVPQSRPAIGASSVPRYNILNVAAYGIMIVGSMAALGYVAFGISFALSSLSSSAGNSPMEQSLYTAMMMGGMTAGLVMIVAGLVTALFAFASGQLLLAVRDMAINSFHIRFAVAR